ncbi:MAG TPA: TonB-dependent receptor plug domain-containing protein [Flavobacterium sp.]|uniref:TonB-dependent receptor plug domain-containing protein n=1 Tax=Flavobacterium sp. TaxID=239 RepID=UPI002B63B8EB|nr:TonB-dependent receptor plug domain-containing protein [Flavobacterium sp.]HNP33671.1 TonB-dependent receptor plug domain-containing protein [Flavobacterium sp.]
MLVQKKLFSLLLLLTFLAVRAQQEDNTIPLKTVLEEISSKDNVKFNYIEEELVLYKIIPPNTSLSLSEKIEYIESKTRLKIKKINETYYSIFNDKGLDKPLCGYLLDADSGIPIDNATIRIINTNTTVFSNEKGYFELPIVSPNAIEITHINYEKKTFSPNDLYTTDCPKIKMALDILELEEVVTQRYLTSGIYKKNDGSVEIKPSKFGILPGLTEADVLQTMQQIPGINSVDETVSNINVRGGTHDQNLFLWNGIRMFQTGHFFGLISAFNSSLAQTISVTKNGSSAFFGESVSSLIDISSHLKTVEKSSNSATVNLISAEFFSKIKLSDKSNFIISGRRSLTDFFSSPTYKNYRNKVFQNTVITNLNNNQTVDFNTDETFYFYDFTTQFQQKISPKSELAIDAIMIKNSLGVIKSNSDINRYSDLGQKNLGATINWKTNWNAKNSTQLQTYISSYSLVSKNEALDSNQILNQENKVLDIGFQIKNSHSISETVTFNNGYQFDETGVTNFDEINSPFFSRKVKEVLRKHALVAEGIFETESKNTFIKAGIRANYFSKLADFLIEPRIQFNQALSKKIRLEILGEQKSQTLSQVIDLQQDFLGIEKRRWTLANNTTVPIQKSNQISIGFSFKDKNWLITIDNFYKKITGITTSGQGFQNQLEFNRSSGNYSVIGTEVLLQKNFGKFYTWMSYSYNDNKYDFRSLTPAEFVNNYELKHCISWAGIYEWNSVKLSLGCKWHTGKPITTPKTTTLDSDNQIVYNSPNNSRLNDFFQVNFSASKEWKISKKMMLQVDASVLNILNTKNSINRFYRVNTSNNSIESLNTYALEFTPNINVKLNF